MAEVRKALEKEDIQRIVDRNLQDAIDYTEQELSPQRAKATDYYLGKPFGTEEEGRSRIMLTVVRDTVIGFLPSLLRVLFSAERVVEYVPKTAKAAEMAEQATEYVHWAFMERCNGFLESLAVLKDGLIRRLGAFKWGWESEVSVHPARIQATDAEIELLASDDSIDLRSITPTGTVDPNGMPLNDVELVRYEESGKPWVTAIPPEEFIFSRDARGPREATLIGHRTRLSTSKLRQLGISEEDIAEHGGDDDTLKLSQEEIARRGHVDLDAEGGEANELHAYFELYMRLDVDGDGIAELVKVVALGPGRHVVSIEPVDDIPFAPFIPDPEPHTMDGLSLADRTMDLQWSMSHMMRAVNDSLALSIFPRIAYVDGRASVQDILNNETGAPIRMDAPGMVTPFSQEFTGAKALPVLEFLKQVLENRTGLNEGAIGLDADALQSSTKSAVGAAVTAAQAQPEMIARVFAEMTLKPLFRGLLKLFVKYQPRAEVARIRGKWVDIDPRYWDADMDVSVNVALGATPVEEKLAALGQITQKQELILQTLGPTNPIVGLVEYRNTLGKACELLGFKDSSKFFKEISQEQLDALAAQAAQAQEPQQPSPEMVLAQAQIQVEQMKTQARIAIDRMKAENELAIAQARLELDRERMALEDDRARDKQAAEIQLKIKELESKHLVDLNEAQISADIERERITTQAAVQRDTARSVAAAATGKQPPKPKRTMRIERDETGRAAAVHMEESDD